EPEGVVGAEGADLQGLDRQLQIVDRARRRGEVEHGIDRSFDLERLGDVVVQEVEARSPAQMRDVLRPPGDQVVDADDPVPFGEQPVAEVRAEKTGSSSDHRPLHERTPAVRASAPGIETTLSAAGAAGRPPGRPMETYSNPAAAIFSGS